MRVHTSIATLAAAAAVLVGGAPQAQAQNGYIRQGVGAVNPSMGGGQEWRPRRACLGLPI
jgi:hypothetical protein